MEYFYSLMFVTNAKAKSIDRRRRNDTSFFSQSIELYNNHEMCFSNLCCSMNIVIFLWARRLIISIKYVTFCSVHKLQ